MCLVKGCVKFVLFGFNLVFVLIGIALISIGTIYKINFTDITDAIPDNYEHISLIPILTIVVGCVIFVIAFFGCCGAVRDNSCLLTTYAVILLLIFVLQIALGVFAFLEINDKDDLKEKVYNTIDEIFLRDQDRDGLAGFIQQELKCCGTTGPSFWTHIPSSCCEAEKTCTIANAYKDGCRAKFYDFLVDSAKISGIVVLALSATEVFGAIVSLCLANSIRNSERRSYY